MKINQIFKHLKYFINPVWYFYLDSTKNNSIWISYDDMPEEVKKVINYFPNYNNEYFVDIDCTYQAWARGYINNNTASKGLEIFESVTIELLSSSI